MKPDLQKLAESLATLSPEIKLRINDVAKILYPNPKLLTHPNIPKELHGLSPRTIMGQAQWDVLRQKVYASTDYHCAACGVHKSQAKEKKWLEAHENYEIKYLEATLTITEIVPLCHYCHSFIHSGRLYKLYESRKISFEFLNDVFEHGFKILKANNLDAFWGTYEIANHLRINRFGVGYYPITDSEKAWGRWRMIYNGKEYKGKFSCYEEWARHYSSY